MKQLVYKEAITDRLLILKANTIFTLQKETAYWANNWASVFSTLFYTLTMLLFINVLYANVTLFVGYTKQEMLLFFFSLFYLGQHLRFYISATPRMSARRDSCCEIEPSSEPYPQMP